MTPHVLALLLEALASGAITVQYGRITDRCGYVDTATRTVVLNPDATPEQLAAELAHDLGPLVGGNLHALIGTDEGAPRPALEVLPGGGARPDVVEQGADVLRAVLRVAE